MGWHNILCLALLQLIARLKKLWKSLWGWQCHPHSTSRTPRTPFSNFLALSTPGDKIDERRGLQIAACSRSDSLSQKILLLEVSQSLHFLYYWFRYLCSISSYRTHPYTSHLCSRDWSSSCIYRSLTRGFSQIEDRRELQAQKYCFSETWTPHSLPSRQSFSNELITVI